MAHIIFIKLLFKLYNKLGIVFWLDCTHDCNLVSINIEQSEDMVFLKRHMRQLRHGNRAEFLIKEMDKEQTY